MRVSAAAHLLVTCALLALLHDAVAQQELVRVGNFLRAVSYAPNAAPACIVPACQDESNINFVLPPLCCNLLATGPFLSFDYVTTAVNFSVPQFLAAALATPACRGDVFARTQASFAGLGKWARAQASRKKKQSTKLCCLAFADSGGPNRQFRARIC